MEIRKYKCVNGSTTYDAYELECTPAERDMLRELLAHEGVNLCTSVSGADHCTCYVRNEYRQAVQGWGSDLCKQIADEFFERGKKH